VTERDLLNLLAADALWGELPYTNRDHWRERLDTWVKEINELGPRLNPEPSGAAGPQTEPEYPVLCRPTISSIARLENESLEEISQRPIRGTRLPDVPDVGAFLARLLGAAQGSEGQGPASGTNDSAPEEGTGESLGQALKKLRALLEQAAGKGNRQLS
jgi:hypothetical protein